MIPRLNGFEILMASYAMAHLKLDLLLQETGYNASSSGPANQRFKIYLTNSLEEHYPDSGTLFANWLSEEANEANHIKRDTPVMVVMGNPPYSVSSSNKGEWIESLMMDYKRNLNERNINPLSDDYIKFIRFGQYFIKKNGEGVLAYISNNSFLDGIIHREMRRSLVNDFDKIYVLDLHGNSKKLEKSPDGNKDENVFDIQQGVSINIFIKKNLNRKESQIFKANIYGDREKKYNHLLKNSISNIDWKLLRLAEPNLYFVETNKELLDQFGKFFSVENLFGTNATGIKTEKDNLVIQLSLKEISEVLISFKNLSEDEIKSKFRINKEGRDWKVKNAIVDIRDNFPKNVIIQYRPFDFRYTLYTGKTKGIMAYPRHNIMKHIDNRENLFFVSTRRNRGLSSGYFFISNKMLDLHLLDSSGDSLQTFPLYLYPDENGQQLLDGKPEPAFAESGAASAGRRTPNLDKKLLKEIEAKLGLSFVPEKEEPVIPQRKPGSGSEDGATKENKILKQVQDDVEKGKQEVFAPIDILDYIYAVLHSPAYREKYKEFLKIDFPRVPYPEDPDQFWQLVELGGELRQIHLLEADTVEKFITTYPADGDNVVRNRITKNDPGFVPFASGIDEAFGVVDETKQSPDNEQLTGDRHVASAPRERDSASARESESNVLGKVWINEDQYFDKVPLVAWEFYIGGYQPAQKWLKDRRDRELSIDDIRHYQKIIVALTETDRIMNEIDEVSVVEVEADSE